MSDQMNDERLTLAGLVFESSSGLRDVLERSLHEDCGLAAQWFEVLIRLARTPGHSLRMSALAAQTTLTPSGLTRAVDRLEEAGLVARTSCPSDRRGSLAAITDEGVRTISAALPGHLVAVEENLTGLLTDRERRQLQAILRKLRDHVKPGATAGTEEPAG